MHIFKKKLVKKKRCEPTSGLVTGGEDVCIYGRDVMGSVARVRFVTTGYRGHTGVHIFVSIERDTYIHTHIHTYIYMSVFTCVCIYVCININTERQRDRETERQRGYRGHRGGADCLFKSMCFTRP